MRCLGGVNVTIIVVQCSNLFRLTTSGMAITTKHSLIPCRQALLVELQCLSKLTELLLNEANPGH